MCIRDSGTAMRILQKSKFRLKNVKEPVCLNHIIGGQRIMQSVSNKEGTMFKTIVRKTSSEISAEAFQIMKEVKWKY